jgi:hypothetical protein
LHYPGVALAGGATYSRLDDTTRDYRPGGRHSLSSGKALAKLNEYQELGSFVVAFCHAI